MKKGHLFDYKYDNYMKHHMAIVNMFSSEETNIVT